MVSSQVSDAVSHLRAEESLTLDISPEKLIFVGTSSESLWKGWSFTVCRRRSPGIDHVPTEDISFDIISADPHREGLFRLHVHTERVRSDTVETAVSRYQQRCGLLEVDQHHKNWVHELTRSRIASTFAPSSWHRRHRILHEWNILEKLDPECCTAQQAHMMLTDDGRRGGVVFMSSGPHLHNNAQRMHRLISGYSIQDEGTNCILWEGSWIIS